MSGFTIMPEGDSALRVCLGDTIDLETNVQVHALADRLEAAGLAGVSELVPSYCSLLVLYDSMVTDHIRLSKAIRRLVKQGASSKGSKHRVLQVPCCYDGEDLQDVADLAGLSVDEVIRIHSEQEYRIYMLGFLPGFVYLGGLDQRIHAPRLQSPRKAIPAGSVGIGGSQTGIYPMTSPGGWRLIGRTPLTMYDPQREPSILVKAGDSIRFVPITEQEYEEMQAKLKCGELQPKYQEVEA